MSYFAALDLCGWSEPLSAIEKTVQWTNYEFSAGAHAKWGTADYDPNVLETWDRYGPTDVFITDPRGYQGIIEALAAESLDESMYLMESPIAKIEYDDNVK